MPRKIKLTDKLRKFFNFGGSGSRGGMNELHSPSTGTYNGDSEPSVSTVSSHHASPGKQLHSPARPMPSPPAPYQPALAQPPRRTMSNRLIEQPVKERAALVVPAPAEPAAAPADSNESGSTNPTRSVPMQQAASQIQQSTAEQRQLQLEHVASLLRSGTDEQKVNAAELMFNLTAENENVKEEVAHLGVIQPLVTMLRAGNNKGRMFAAYTLSSLTSSDTLRMEMQQRDAIPALVYVLAESSRPDIRKGAMRALGRLARCDDAACSIIVAAGGLSPMMTLLNSLDNSLVRRCLIALYFIGADKPDLQVAISHAGAIPRLLALCEADSPEVQAESVDVLKMLARNLHCGQQIAEAGGLEVLGQMALNGQGSRSGQSATRAIQRLYENPKLKEMMRHMNKAAVEQEPDNEVQQLVDIVARGDRWIREKAVQAIETVAADDPTVSKELVDCGVVETLVALLRSSLVKERTNAARALGNMSTEPYVRTRIVSSGAVPLLVADISQPDQALQEVCLVTLEKLLDDVDAAAIAAEELCVPATLRLLASSMDPILHHLCLRVLYLTCHSQGKAKSQLLETGGVDVLVRFCWQGSVELQRLAATILQDLAAHPTTHHQLIAGGALVALTALALSPQHSVADASMTALDSLKAAAENDVLQLADAEQQLQQQVSLMLGRVREKVEIGSLLEQAFRLVPRGAFVPGEQATHSAAYSDRSIVVAHLGISMIAPHLESLALESLQLSPGLSFLEAGSGSGFTTCLAACLLGSSGQARGVELDASVCDHARRCSTRVMASRPLQYCRQPEYANMDILQLLQCQERWDCILVSMACPRELLRAVVGLLKPSGRLVAPCDGDLLLINEASGMAGAQILARNVPYRSMALPHPLQQQDISPPPHPHPVTAHSYHSSGGNTSSSPHASVDVMLAPSTPSESGSHPQQQQDEDAGAHSSYQHQGGDQGNGHHSPSASASSSGSQPALRANSGRLPETRIPSSAAKQRTPDSPSPSPASQRAAGRRPAAVDQRLQRAGGSNAAGSAARARSPRPAAAAAVVAAGSKALLDRVDSHLGASPSAMDNSARSGAPPRQAAPRRRTGDDVGSGGPVLLPKKAAAAATMAKGKHDGEAAGKPPLDPTTTEQLSHMGVSQGVSLMKWSDIEICRNAEGKKCRLGEGGFGVVYRALMNNVDEIAVKVVKNDNPTPKEREVFVKEVSILSRLHHRNIVQFYGACLQPGSMFIVTELMKGGDLYTALRNHPETMRWEHLGKKVALDVALGVNYLHSQRPPMMHRDLKSPNVLLSEEGVAKIADVGMVRSQVKDLVTAQPVMTPLWAAPEVMRHERASIKADIWSYGILIWELVSGEDITDYQPLAMSMQLGAKAGDGKVMTLPLKCPAVAQLLFKQCCQQDAEDRPTAQQLVEWLRNDRGD